MKEKVLLGLAIAIFILLAVATLADLNPATAGDPVPLKQEDW